MELESIGKTPIGPSNPSGDDARYEPEYEELTSEIGKLSSPTAGGGIVWGRVISLASTILANKSKNLLVASYLSVGLVQEQGLEGLASGTRVLLDLMENFWDSLYPPAKRMRARKNAMEWWSENLLSAMEALPEGSLVSEEAKAAIGKSIRGIDSFLGEKMEDGPLLFSLIKRVDALATPEPVREEKPPPPPPPLSLPKKAPPPPPKAAAPSPPPVAEETKDPQRVMRQGLDLLRQASTLLMQRNPFSPQSYRLSRLSAWLDVEHLPPAEDGRTHIPPPMTEFIAALGSLSAQGKYQDLLEAAESRVGQYLFWLDLSRYVHDALGRLNQPAAQEVVAEETARYFKRLRGIERLSFSDGTPFADGATQDWLKEISREGEGAEAVMVSGDDEEARIAEAYEGAKALMKGKKLAEALDLLQGEFMGASSQRSRLLRRLSFVRLLGEAKRPRLALPHLLEILSDIERYSLEIWSPDLAVRALREVCLGLRAQPDKEYKVQAGQVLDRISRLNPAVAIRIEE